MVHHYLEENDISVTTDIAPYPESPLAAPKPEFPPPPPKKEPPKKEDPPPLKEEELPLLPPLPPLPEFPAFPCPLPPAEDPFSVGELCYGLFGAFLIGAITGTLITYSFSKTRES